jgi:ribosome-associated protein
LEDYTLANQQPEPIEDRDTTPDASTPPASEPPEVSGESGAIGSGGARAGLPSRAGPTRSRRRRPAIAADQASTVPAELEVDEQALELARRIVELAADKKAVDVVLLDVRAQTTVTDYFVVCSGASERQLGAIADGIVEGLKAAGTKPIGREGGPTAHWALLDYGSVIVHVMAPQEREYYALEKLWADAPLLLRVL